MWGEFGDQLSKLPTRLLVSPRTGTDRVASAAASEQGLEIWQVASKARLASIPWSVIARIDPSTTYAARYSYPTVVLHVTDVGGRQVSLPLMSANSGYVWPRTSVAEVDEIIEKLNELRKHDGTQDTS